MKKQHGGKRKEAGRPKLKKSEKKEPTKVIRIPKSWSKKRFVVYDEFGSVYASGNFL